MGTRLSFSIIIPVKPGGEVRALRAIAALDYPSELVEIIISEGCKPSRQRNKAANEASGDIVYFLDDDSLLDSGALKILASHFTDASVAVVGGPSLTPSTDSTLQKGFGTVLSSTFGAGGVRNRYRRTGTVRITGESELILCNLAFRRKIYLESGGLDERLYPNEENELMDRIQKGGWKMLHDPDLAISRSQRSTYPAFARQLFTYGRGRGEQTVISRNISLPSLVPPLFVLYIISIPIIHNPVYTIPLLCYASIVLLASFYDAVSERQLLFFILLPSLFITLHIAYGAGLIAGLLAPRFRKMPISVPEVTIRKLTI